MAELTPVTLLTGFLGAGKTTLLNRLLRDPRLARAAVLVNEFGEAGIDHLLVEKIDSTTVLLDGGCVCCAVRGDLIRALRTMLPRARRDEITHVLIETSGVADPVPVMTTLMRDPAVAGAYRLHNVITVVDAVNGPTNLDAFPEARRQVAVADHIVLSKTDLADPAPLEPPLRRLNPMAPIHDLSDRSIDLFGLVESGLPSGIHKTNRGLRRLAADAPTDHDDDFDSVSLTWDHPLDWSALAAALTRLTGAHGDKLLRIKGLLWLQGKAKPFAIHAAGHLIHPLSMADRWPDDAFARSRLVFITAGLPRSVIMDALGSVRPMAERSEGAV